MTDSPRVTDSPRTDSGGFRYLVDADWLHRRLDDPDLVLIDATAHISPDGQGGYVNQGRVAYTAGHIPGAVFADLLDDVNESSPHMFMLPSAEKFAAAAGRLGIGPGRQVVVYDQGGTPEAAEASVWAARLWWQLRYEGFDDVVVLAGGYRGWVGRGLPTKAGTEHNQPTSFVPARRPELVADRDAVLAAIGDPAVLVVDSRSRDAYLGSADRPYRAGHIPGARHLDSRTLVDTRTGEPLPAAEIDTRMRGVGAFEQAGGRTVFYCGGGVSAAWNALALAAVGGPDAAVYDGSMLERAADPDLPLVLGAES
ncbi:sulfurtransferase [Parafrankia sp. FMc6]|uniref:sulfurtransferase n=1 Tax=Parafrankia soli TaxID=2599596 RepID=UPI0034D5816B